VRQTRGKAAANRINTVLIKIGISLVALRAAMVDGVPDEMITSTLSASSSSISAGRRARSESAYRDSTT
jgi:hypothetical protein